MSKTKHLTDWDQVLINEIRKNGLMIRQIAEDIQRIKSVVGRFLKREENPKIPKKKGENQLILIGWKEVLSNMLQRTERTHIQQWH